MKQFLDEFKCLLDSICRDKKPSILRALRQCSNSLKSINPRDILLSDFVVLVDILLKLGTCGYEADAGSPHLWKQLTEDAFDDPGCNSSRSDHYRHGLSTSKQSTLRIIRGESLRCLYDLIRADPVRASDLRMSVYGQGIGRPGLPFVVLLDQSYYVRRFALYCMVSLLVPLKSAIPGVRRLHCRRATPETRFCLQETIVCVVSMLARQNREDQSSVAHILWDVVEISTHIPSEEDHSARSTLINSLVSSVAGLSPDSETCEFMICLGKLLNEDRPSFDDQSVISNLLQSIEPSSPLNLPASCLLGRSLSDVPAGVSNLVLVSAVYALKDIGVDKALTPSQRFQVKSCLEKLGYISTMDAHLECVIVALSQEPPDWSVDSLMVGLGKLSRTSERALEVVLKSNLFEMIKIPSSRVVQAIGDIVFSSILFDKENVVTESLSCVLAETWLYREDLRGAALRTIMTGLSRMCDEGLESINHSAFKRIRTSCASFLMNLWEDSRRSRDERLVADSIRCIGLLVRVTDMSDTFIKASRDVIIQALLSGRTQRVLSGLATIRLKPDILSGRDIAIIDDLLEETCSKLELRTVWDYDSADMLAGQLHIVLEAWMLLSEGSSPLASHPSFIGRLRGIIAANPKLRKLDKYNNCICTFLDRIDSVLSTYPPC